MYLFRIIKCIALVSALGLALPVAARTYSLSWDVERLASSRGLHVDLRDRNGRLYRRVRVSRMSDLFRVERRMEKVSETQAKLVIVDGRRANAFAGKARGDENIVAINFAMLDILGVDRDAAAALIGHELAHIRLNHGEKRKSRNATNQTMRILGGALLGGYGSIGAQAISDMSFTAIDRKYDRDDERQADYLGAIWAVQAGYDLGGAVRLQEKVYKKSGNTALAFLSTHPTGPERIARLKALQRRLSTK